VTEVRTKRKPGRFGRRARRVFYKTVHAVIPRKVREPLRNAIKGPPPTPEELAARRQAEEAERQARREAQQRAKAEHATEKERETWVKVEADALKREAVKDDRVKVDSERRVQKEAQERDRAGQAAEKERKARAKAEADSAKRVERSKEGKPKPTESAPSAEVSEHAEQEEA
jgi:hypothetical protein